VYLCVAQILGLDAHGVLRPGHFLVQQRDPGNSCNVELLRRGELMPDAWYSERFPLSQPGSRSYGRPLSSQEVVGVAAFNVGNECRRQNQWSAAKKAYGEAVVAFPTFAEAHAGLGSIQQLLGDRGAAAESYARAVELDQTLPGIEKNLALLGIGRTVR
jgi:tetratricopeptide (TPR) repeat protein